MLYGLLLAVGRLMTATVRVCPAPGAARHASHFKVSSLCARYISAEKEHLLITMDRGKERKREGRRLFSKEGKA